MTKIIGINFIAAYLPLFMFYGAACDATAAAVTFVSIYTLLCSVPVFEVVYR